MNGIAPIKHSSVEAHYPNLVDELAELVQLINQRIGRCLERQGLPEQYAEGAWLGLEPAKDIDAMPILLGSSRFKGTGSRGQSPFNLESQPG